MPRESYSHFSIYQFLLTDSLTFYTHTTHTHIYNTLQAFGKKITFHERQKQLKKARELPPSQFVQALQEKYPMHVMPEKRLASQGRKRSRNTMSRVDRILIESKMRKIRDTDPDEYNKLLESRNYLNASFLSEEEKLEEMAKMNRKSWRKLNPLSESFFEPPPPKSRVFTGRNFDALDELKREQSYITGTLNPARQIGFRDAKPQKIKYVGKWLELGSRKIEQRQPTPLESLLNTPSLSSSSLALLSSSSSSSSSPLSLTSSSSYDLQQSTNANLPSHVDSETINGNFLPSLTTPTPEIGWESLMTLYKQERRKNKPRQGIRKFSKTLIKTAKLERWLRAVRVEQANAVRNKMAKGKERLRKKRESLKQLKLEAQTIAAAQRLQEENLKSQALTLGLYSRHDEILKEEEKKVYQDILLQSLYSIKPSPSSSSPSPSLSSLSSSSKTTTSTSTSTSALSPTSKKSQEEWEKFNELSGSKLKALFRQREGFVDRAHVTIRAGNGGQGRPAGVGGHGGNILAVVKSSASLASIQKSIVGNHGTNSDHKQPRGKSGKDTIINVPLGSIITNSKTKQLIADMSTVGKIALLAKGGRGGGYEGSLKGLKGEALSVNIELKSIADVGLVG